MILQFCLCHGTYPAASSLLDRSLRTKAPIRLRGRLARTAAPGSSTQRPSTSVEPSTPAEEATVHPEHTKVNLQHNGPPAVVVRRAAQDPGGVEAAADAGAEVQGAAREARGVRRHAVAAERAVEDADLTFGILRFILGVGRASRPTPLSFSTNGTDFWAYVPCHS